MPLKQLHGPHMHDAIDCGIWSSEALEMLSRNREISLDEMVSNALVCFIPRSAILNFDS